MGLYSSHDLQFSAFRNQVSVLLSFSVTHRLVQIAFKVFLMLNRLHFKKKYGRLSYYLRIIFSWKSCVWLVWLNPLSVRWQHDSEIVDGHIQNLFTRNSREVVEMLSNHLFWFCLCASCIMQNQINFWKINSKMRLSLGGRHLEKISRLLAHGICLKTLQKYNWAQCSALVISFVSCLTHNNKKFHILIY